MEQWVQFAPGIDDVQDLVIQPEVAGPLLNTRFTIDSLLTQLEANGSEVSSQDDGLIVLAFEDSLFSLRAQNFCAWIMSVHPWLIPLPKFRYRYLGGGTIREARIRTGSFGYDLQIGLPGQFALTIEMPDARNAGVGLVIMDTIQDLETLPATCHWMSMSFRWLMANFPLPTN